MKVARQEIGERLNNGCGKCALRCASIRLSVVSTAGEGRRSNARIQGTCRASIPWLASFRSKTQGKVQSESPGSSFVINQLFEIGSSSISIAPQRSVHHIKSPRQVIWNTTARFTYFVTFASFCSKTRRTELPWLLAPSGEVLRG